MKHLLTDICSMEHQLISYLRLFRPVSDEEGELISGYFERRSFKEGETIFRAERICREFFFVCNGVLRIASVNDKGVEVTHYFYKENQFCTILQSFNEETPAVAGIEAACDAEVLAITKVKLLELYTRVPFLKEIIDRLNQLRLIEKVNVRNAYVGEDAESQYKLFIMQNPDIALRVPLKYIASYLGITPQSLSRIRKNIR
jgi:CRP-like cAMP-binding protein